MQQQVSMMVPQYGGYGGNGYGMQQQQHQVPPYNNQVPVAGGGGYGHRYGNSQMAGPVSGDYGARVPPNSGGGYPDGSQYGFPPSSGGPGIRRSRGFRWRDLLVECTKAHHPIIEVFNSGL
ncbi:hypothetical protein glysoja_032522 [Glycine soja]|uniref:Uncharacterized protein n=1 Tax=Glycine soja TaxID=3848 RepID=A0A0B2RJ46_GLYSO|nr:hypothetical protein glysoja_032522 [Glycine soja]